MGQAVISDSLCLLFCEYCKRHTSHLMLWSVPDMICQACKRSGLPKAEAAAAGAQPNPERHEQ